MSGLIKDTAIYGDCQLFESRRVDDGEGALVTTWYEGAIFQAAITLDNSIEARAAEARDAIGIYTVTTSRGINLKFHDVFKRLKDGKIFRVTTDGVDNATPNSARLDMRQVNAQEWELPT